MNNELHIIFGTGPLGISVMNELRTKNKTVKMVNRSGKANVPNSVEVIAANIFDVESAKRAASGATVVYQCVNAPYHLWPEQFPPLQKNILEVAAITGAKLIIGENVYMYGDTNGKPLTEDLPYTAKTRKGKTRAEMAESALQAHREGKVRVAIGRASDYFGPGVFASAMGERVIVPALKGKTVSLVGNIDLPHTLSYINDVGKALVTLAENENALGQVWHIPNPQTVSQREFVNMVFGEIRKTPKISTMGKLMLSIGGLFIPAAKETIEMLYEFEKPFIIDSTKFEKTFGWKATEISVAIKETVAWYRKHFNI